MSKHFLLTYKKRREDREHPVQQIDLKIYDGACQLVSFVKDSITSLRLHIRRVLQ